MTLYDTALKLMFRLPPERIHGIISGALGVLNTLTPGQSRDGKGCARTQPAP